MIGRRWLLALLPLVLSIAVGGGTALAASLTRVATIKVPVKAGTAGSFDIGWYDAGSDQYYLADRVTGGIDVVNASTDQFIKTLGSGYGPNGVLREGDTIWFGDNSSKLIGLNASTGAVVASISTGGKKRADELAYDPVAHEILIANPDETATPPFITFVSTTTNKILSKLSMPEATGGIEQSAFVPSTGMFDLAIPKIGSGPSGAVDEINPKTMKVVASWPMAGCTPGGLALGPNDQAIVACSGDGIKAGLKAETLIINDTNGSIVTTLNYGGSDEAWYDPTDQTYYTASSNMTTNGLKSGKSMPELVAVSAVTHQVVATIRTQKGAHSVAVSSKNNHVFGPIKKPDTIRVYVLRSGAALPKTGSSPWTEALAGVMLAMGAVLALGVVRGRRSRA